MKFLLTAVLLAVLIYFSVQTVGRAIDQRIAEIDKAIACLDSTNHCEENP